VWRPANDHNSVSINAPLDSSDNVQNWLSNLGTSNPLVPLAGYNRGAPTEHMEN